MLIEDQIGHSITLKAIPKRIISLVPSQTELLFDLGLGDAVVGITKFCVHPKAWYQTKRRVGGTKNIDLKKVDELTPDLIIGNKEENTKDAIHSLQLKYPVYTSDIKSIDDAVDFILAMGKLFDLESKAIEIAYRIQLELKGLKKLTGNVVYLIWKNPYMGVGEDTFIAHMLRLVGLYLVKTNNQSRYPTIENEEFKKLAIDYIFLSSEPFPFGQKHIEELQSITNAKIELVDGELFSWYGSRLLKFKSYWENKLLPSLLKP